MADIEIKVPTLGESVSEATVASWFKKEGEAVKADEAVAELETDKVTVEVYAPVAGVLAAIKVASGETVEVGTVLGVVAEGATATAAPKSAKTEEKEAASSKAAASAAPAPKTTEAFPAARKLAAENNVAVENLDGSGKGGRVTKGDVLQAMQTPQAAPASSAAGFPYQAAGAPREERVKMSRLRQRIAQRLKEAQNTAAMLTTFNEIDMSAVMALRGLYKEEFEKRHGVKLGFMGFFVKAAIQALQEIPAVNAEIQGDEIVYKNFYDIGVAVGTENGLVVPVLRNSDALTLSGVEKGIADLAVKARNGKLSIEDMTGGTFTITNGGVYGSLMSTPIINPPQSGILGLHKIQERPIVVQGKIEIRPMMYVALSYDHRIIDGKEAVTFLVRLKQAMEDPQRILLAV